MKQEKLITKPSYPRSFLAGGIWDELIWDFTVTDLKANPQACLGQNGVQFLYDMLLDALDKLQDSERHLATVRREYSEYKRLIRSAAQ